MKAITSILAGVVAMVAAVAPQAQADRLSDKPAERIKLLDKVSHSTFGVGSNVGSNVRPEAYAQVLKDLGLPAELMSEIELYRQNRKNPRQHTVSLIIRICTQRQVTMLQLSILLNREAEPLRRKS